MKAPCETSLRPEGEDDVLPSSVPPRVLHKSHLQGALELRRVVLLYTREHHAPTALRNQHPTSGDRWAELSSPPPSPPSPFSSHDSWAEMLSLTLTSISSPHLACPSLGPHSDNSPRTAFQAGLARGSLATHHSCNSSSPLVQHTSSFSWPNLCSMSRERVFVELCGCLSILLFKTKQTS